MTSPSDLLGKASWRERFLYGLVLVLFAAFLHVQTASATNCSVLATSVSPGSTVTPADCTGTAVGTLLASDTAPFTSASGNVAGTLISAVYQESGGTLDFLYQITNNSTCPNPTCEAITGETDFVFTGFTTGVATRSDGGSLAGAGFANGSVFPSSADRNSTGDIVGWSFGNPSVGPISPGDTSIVLVITTNATLFTPGHAFVIDGGKTEIASFEPAPTVPEPTSVVLFGSGLLGLAGAMRRKLRG